jgi:RNA polymerase sporulation-specific sigma factor
MERTVKKREDEELVERSKAGDQQATDELMLRYASLVRSLAHGFFLVGGEAEDLVQEGMIGLYQAIIHYQKEQGVPEQKTFKNFAYLCVRRKIIDALKKSTSKKNKALNESVSVEEVQLFSCVVDPEEHLILSDERQDFKRRMSGVLSDFEFKIIWMYMEGMTRAEICESTGKTQKSVDNAIERSKKKLQQLLKR